MKSLRIKLFSGISMFAIALSMLIIGVWAVGETQTITMQGSVNFEIADKSLYVQDVRMQEDINSAPYSLKDQGKFMPGFINGNFDMNLGDFTNSYGSFALYFDIINTMDETTNETFAYTVEQPTAPSGATVSVSILSSDGLALEQIPQGTVKPSQITDSTQITATIKLTIASTSSSSVDLSGITIIINQVVPEVYDYFTFEVNDDNQTVTLTDYNKNLSDSTDIVIPSTVSQNSSGEWIEGNTYTVTAITGGNYNSGVFYNSGITSVTFPSSLTSIGDYAFQNCSGLTGELNLGGCTSLTSIGRYAFYDCSGLTSISLPSSLTSIGDWAFNGCDGLTGELNLGGCTSLTSIGSYVFYFCDGLTSVDLSGCTSLTSIGSNAFCRCSGLTGELNLGGCTSLTSIGNNAFEYCSGLTSITLPTSLTSIGDSAFYMCLGLTGTLNLENCTVLTSIGRYAFNACKGLTGDLNLGNCTRLTSIGEEAFRLCSGLTGDLNLENCTSLTSIGDSAFYWCSGLTGTVTIPASVTEIGINPFTGCSKLERIVVEEGNSEYYLEGNCLIENSTKTLIIGFNNSTIPSDIKIIGGSAFYDCSGLTSISLPSSLTSIGEDAFYGCRGLTSISLPSSLTSIGERAFSSCRGLTSVDLSGCTNLTNIERYAFQNCSALESVVFPEGSTGWYVTTSSTATSGTSVTVTDPSVNASNLTGKYRTYYWKRNV